jgi:hypothetical protein
MKLLIVGIAAASISLAVGAVRAEPYVDYKPTKGLWHIQTIKVDPNHIDDYLVGLKHTWIPGEEMAKRHGLIDMYSVETKLNAADGRGNVVLIEHIPNIAMMEPDQARDQAMEKEMYAAMPKADMDAKVKGYEGYRTFVGDDYYSEVDFPN